MNRAVRLVLLALGYFASASAVDAQSAQQNQQKVDELVRSAQLFETIGYVLGGAGFLLVIGSVVYAIYADRKKKARKLATSDRPRRGMNPDEGTPSRE